MKAAEYVLPKEWTLDYSLWRCGSGNVMATRRLGEGATALLNIQGFMCCLGHASLAAGVPKETIHSYSSPCRIQIPIEGLSQIVDGELVNTKLSEEAIYINDSPYTTIVEKIKKLKAEFAKHGYTMNVINLPKEIEDELQRDSSTA